MGEGSGFTIIAMTVSLVAVLSRSVHGRHRRALLQEFAVTIVSPILVSCFVSISLPGCVAAGS